MRVGQKLLMLVISRFHAFVYRVSGGRMWTRIRGMNVLLLTATGRKSGQQRTKPLAVFQDDGRYIVIASGGGSVEHPAWYLNLAANPSVEVQWKREKFSASASTATGEERIRLWKIATDQMPMFQDYADKVEREIPVVILTKRLSPVDKEGEKQ